MSYELNGKLLAKYDTIQRTESFKVREFVVEKSEDISGRIITNYIKFQCIQDKTAIVDKINVGDEIKVHFNIKGTKWDKDGKTSYFTNLDAWRIEQVQLGGTDTTEVPVSSKENSFPESINTFTPAAPEAIDDLPF